MLDQEWLTSQQEGMRREKVPAVQVSGERKSTAGASARSPCNHSNRSTPACHLVKWRGNRYTFWQESREETYTFITFAFNIGVLP